jgi:hypothetical protein
MEDPMGYVVSERMLRHRAERDERVRTKVRWWRRKKLQKMYAMVDRIYDATRQEEALCREEALRASGERGAE